MSFGVIAVVILYVLSHASRFLFRVSVTFHVNLCLVDGSKAQCQWKILPAQNENPALPQAKAAAVNAAKGGSSPPEKEAPMEAANVEASCFSR